MSRFFADRPVVIVRSQRNTWVASRKKDVMPSSVAR
jgi:hypothetical protein